MLKEQLARQYFQIGRFVWNFFREWITKHFPTFFKNRTFTVILPVRDTEGDFNPKCLYIDSYWPLENTRKTYSGTRIYIELAYIVYIGYFSDPILQNNRNHLVYVGFGIYGINFAVRRNPIYSRSVYFLWGNVIENWIIPFEKQQEFILGVSFLIFSEYWFCYSLAENWIDSR